MIRRLVNLILFSLRYFWMLFSANLTLIRDILSPQRELDAFIIPYPYKCKGEMELFLFTTLITLTPGTISVHADQERGLLYLHAMHATDEKAFIENLSRDLEEPLLEILR